MTANQLVEKITASVVAALKTTQTAKPKRLLTLDEAATYVGRSRRAMEHLAAARVVPIVRHDHRRFFDIQDLDKWIESGKN